MPLDVSHVDVVRFTFFVSVSGRATHFCIAGWHAAWVNRKKPGSKDHREDEMYLTNVTAYSFIYRLIRPRTANILAAFSAVDRTNAAKCSHWGKKAPEKVAAWCSHLAACMQPDRLHTCSQMAAYMRPVCITMQPISAAIWLQTCSQCAATPTK